MIKKSPLQMPCKMLPSNYNELPLDTKQILWMGTIVFYMQDMNFDMNDWIDEIGNVEEITLFEDERLSLFLHYGGSIGIRYVEHTGSWIWGFEDFFTFICKRYEELDLGKNIDPKYTGITLVEYLREAGFPITAQFWHWRNFLSE